jgi:hypothetical protein
MIFLAGISTGSVDIPVPGLSVASCSGREAWKATRRGNKTMTLR